MTEIVIRTMKAQDIPAVAMIEKQLFSQPWSEQAFLDSLQQDTLFLTAWSGNIIAGYCGMYCFSGEGEIVNVAGATGWQNQGVGYRMLNVLKEQSQEKDIRRLILEVRVSNAPAVHLYEKLGFHSCGVRKDLYELPREDGMIMVWEQPPCL